MLFNSGLRRRSTGRARVQFEILHWFAGQSTIETVFQVDFSLEGACANRPLRVGEEYIVTLTQIASFDLPVIDLHRSLNWLYDETGILAQQRAALRLAGLYD
jgi:hypothetical protein